MQLWSFWRWWLQSLCHTRPAKGSSRRVALKARLMLDVNVLAVCSGTVLCAAVWRAGLFLPCGRKGIYGCRPVRSCPCGPTHAVSWLRSLGTSLRDHCATPRGAFLGACAQGERCASVMRDRPGEPAVVMREGGPAALALSPFYRRSRRPSTHARAWHGHTPVGPAALLVPVQVLDRLACVLPDL